MAQAAQANAFDASDSQIHVEHDKKGRQFVIRLNGMWESGVLAGLMLARSPVGAAAF